MNNEMLQYVRRYNLKLYDDIYIYYYNDLKIPKNS